jgi:signal transduction histidine kinase/CheY-like chemotaxis protein
MREAFEVDGCLFFDVVHSAARRESMPTPAHAEDSVSQPSATSSSEDPSHEAAMEEPDKMCDLLGFSTLDKSSVHLGASHDSDMGLVPTRMLATLIRRYPAGKIFNFDIVGDLQSSDSSDEGEIEAAFRREAEDNASPATNERRKRRITKEGVLINQAFPNARSVAFIPVWDLKRERWFAAGFLYTCTPTRVFTVDEELSFLKAFTSLAATEVLNQEVVLADQAKSDALGSLSHELRSPLHGVLLGTELLNDTDLDVFQANLTHTIETCCCTLLDTIDHLLDFSKVNSFATKRKRLPKDKRGLRKTRQTEQFGKKQLSVDVSLDDLVEEVADSMFAGYSFQNLSTGQHATLDGLMNVGGYSRVRERLDNIHADSRKNGTSSPGSRVETVSVYLSIDPSCSWDFHLQPGAIRRVVMNLLGNALKYTKAGNICLYLTQERSSMRRGTGRVVKLIVQDSGKGMSKEFLQHKIFMPFCQEDELAPGTGLGLSLVKTIVTGMGGHINAKSELGIGSTFSVSIPLEPAVPELSEADISSSRSQVFAEQAQALKGLRVRVFGFDNKDGQARDGDGRAILESICRDWLKVELHSAGDESGLTPDLVLWSYEALPESTNELSHLAKMPHVIICQDSQMARRLLKEYESAGYQGVLEFVSQPYVPCLVIICQNANMNNRIGPRKLARSMQHAYKRWTGLTKVSPPQHASAALVENGTVTKPGFIGTPSPLEELASLALDSRLTPRNETPPEIPNLNASLTAPEPEKPIPVRRYTEKDTFLLVDDNHVNLKVLAAYMAKLKLAYVTAVNGKDALDKYIEKPGRFAAILMDVSMPVMDGLEATRQIRTFEREHKLSRVSVLALTGLASDRTHKEAFESGIDVFLTKPVRLQTLREELGLAT